MLKSILFLLITLPLLSFGQDELKFNNNGTTISGVFDTPKEFSEIVIFIAGSGPTDRDGNSLGSNNDCIKLSAQALLSKGIASFRYDKRTVGVTDVEIAKEILFSDFVSDAMTVIQSIDSIFPNKKITLVGHSQGALIATLLANEKQVDKIVLLAGPGRNIGGVLKEQLGTTLFYLKDEINNSIDSLMNGNRISTCPAGLESLLLDYQDFLMNWMSFDPVVELKKVDKPTLIIQGDKDTQVKIVDAELLFQSNENAQLVIIKNMNHVLKKVKSNSQNTASYSDPTYKLNKSYVKELTSFLLN